MKSNDFHKSTLSAKKKSSLSAKKERSLAAKKGWQRRKERLAIKSVIESWLKIVNDNHR